MSSFAAVAACMTLAVLGVFQLALIFGAPLARFAWGGQHRVLPTRLRVGSVVAIALYAAFAIVLLERAGLITVVGSDPFVRVATWVLFGYFILGTVLNGISRSRAERYSMVPVTVILAVLTLLVALG